MSRRTIYKIVVALAVYVGLNIYQSTVGEAWAINRYLGTILLFPLGKIIGDITSSLLFRKMPHSFWEESIAELLVFIGLGLFAATSAEFWRIALNAPRLGDMSIVVALSYLVLGHFRHDGRRR